MAEKLQSHAPPKALSEGKTIEVRTKYKSGTRREFLLISDVHFDNPKCRREKFFAHLEQAKARNAQVLCFGDFFCLMQGKYDPRGSKSAVRPEHNANDYLWRVIEDSAAQLAPFASNLLLFTDGNHETGILKRLEINPLTLLLELLNGKHGANAQKGGYQGFVRFVFEHEAGGNVQTFNLFYHHGQWGGIVTKGVLSVARYASIVPDADIVVSGHTHDGWLVTQPRHRLKQNGEIKVENQFHLKTGTYKEEFEESGGWAVEKIVAPKFIGGWWLIFEAKGNELTVNFEMAL